MLVPRSLWIHSEPTLVGIAPTRLIPDHSPVRHVDDGGVLGCNLGSSSGGHRAIFSQRVSRTCRVRREGLHGCILAPPPESCPLGLAVGTGRGHLTHLGFDRADSGKCGSFSLPFPHPDSWLPGEPEAKAAQPSLRQSVDADADEQTTSQQVRHGRVRF